VHGRVRLKPDGEDVALFHLFRFADGRVVELWDVSQAAPPDSPNEYGCSDRRRAWRRAPASRVYLARRKVQAKMRHPPPCVSLRGGRSGSRARSS
jgi:hypothetical protein